MPPARRPRNRRAGGTHAGRPGEVAHNTTAAREVLAEARDLLGGKGILLDFHVIRHMADIEAIHTFEGTATIQNLIVGRDITGVSAFTAGA
ncbi:MAG: acyl-CoA dehydrogenase family protein [Trebonia sp.]